MGWFRVLVGVGEFVWVGVEGFVGCLSYLAVTKSWDAPSWRQMEWGPLCKIWGAVPPRGLCGPPVPLGLAPWYRG